MWNPPTRPLIDKAVRSILARQLPDGGFNIYAHGPSEISATIKAYTALKLAGLAYDDPNLARLRERILALGGLQAANSYVKVNLSLFGLYPREHTPSIPPELHAAGQSDLRDVLVDARDRDSAFDRARHESAASGAGRIHASRNCSLPGVPLSFPNDEGFLSWRNFFLQGRQVPEVLGAPRVARPAHASHPPRRAMDSGAHPLHRRPRRRSIRP